jgi:pyroglutamyl-peptidase
MYSVPPIWEPEQVRENFSHECSFPFDARNSKVHSKEGISFIRHSQPVVAAQFVTTVFPNRLWTPARHRPAKVIDLPTRKVTKHEDRSAIAAPYRMPDVPNPSSRICNPDLRDLFCCKDNKRPIISFENSRLPHILHSGLAQIAHRTKLAVTGFGPFHGICINPSSELVRRMLAIKHKYPCKHFVLPVHFKRAGRMIRSIIKITRPVILLMFGVDSSQNREVKVEAFAKNIWKLNSHSAVKCIDVSGPQKYASRLPTDQLVRALKDNDIPASVSFSAGTYVCNYTYYCAARFIELHRYDTSYGFVHLPFTSGVDSLFDLNRLSLCFLEFIGNL